jgi:hypothetical protein
MKISIWVRLLLTLLGFSFNLFAPIAVLAQGYILPDSVRYKNFDTLIQRALKNGSEGVILFVKTSFVEPDRPLTDEERQAQEQANHEAKVEMLKKLAPYKAVVTYETPDYSDFLILRLNAQALQMLKYDPNVNGIGGGDDGMRPEIPPLHSAPGPFKLEPEPKSSVNINPNVAIKPGWSIDYIGAKMAWESSVTGANKLIILRRLITPS